MVGIGKAPPHRRRRSIVIQTHAETSAWCAKIQTQALVTQAFSGTDSTLLPLVSVSCLRLLCGPGRRRSAKLAAKLVFTSSITYFFDGSTMAAPGTNAHRTRTSTQPRSSQYSTLRVFFSFLRLTASPQRAWLEAPIPRRPIPRVTRWTREERAAPRRAACRVASCAPYRCSNARPRPSGCIPSA